MLQSYQNIFEILSQYLRIFAIQHYLTLPMLKILSQPYPYPQQTPFRRFLQCLLEGVFIAGFLILFQPFGTAEWHDANKTLFLCGYGFITLLSGLIVRMVLPYFFKTYFIEDNWTIGREILTVILLLALITTGNVLLSNFAFGLSFTFWGFGSMFFLVLLLGFFPISFGILINYIYKLKKYSQPVVIAPPSVQEVTRPLNQPIKLIAENEKDTFEVNVEDLFFIESSDNYSTIHFLKNNTLQKEVLRSSLSRLEAQIASPNIVRCHRSYIVNLDRVARVSGNAQGYKFHLQPTELIVPVARKYSELVEKLR
jgi:LytTr DNA-binding domain